MIYILFIIKVVCILQTIEITKVLYKADCQFHSSGIDHLSNDLAFKISYVNFIVK